jgi:hypothetical protein
MGQTAFLAFEQSPAVDGRNDGVLGLFSGRTG